VIRRIFFDSGKVLIFPSSGHWFYPRPYFDFCDTRGLAVTTPALEDNFRAAYIALTEKKRIPDIAAELEAFTEFYVRLFSGVSGLDERELIRSCAEFTVYSPEKYGFYPDVETAIPALAKDYRIGMITDAWPSVLQIYRDRNLDRYFDPFIISAIHGEDKSDGALFSIALDGVEETPEEILFVDDSPGNLERAAKFGMQVFELNRENGFSGRFPSGSDLSDVQRYLSDPVRFRA
jgi:putative hydrolase of the HAD superfamily